MLSFYVSQYFYLPIGRMLVDMKNFSMLSTQPGMHRNEYEVLSKNIDLIHSSNHRMESVINQSVPLIVELLIKKLLSADPSGNG